MTDNTQDANLRIVDLIAKVAGVNLHNVTRVLLAADLVAANYSVPIGTLMQCNLMLDKPSDLNVIACSRAYDELAHRLSSEGLDDALSFVRSVGVPTVGK